MTQKDIELEIILLLQRLFSEVIRPQAKASWRNIHCPKKRASHQQIQHS
jgi:hypothetical protein